MRGPQSRRGLPCLCLVLPGGRQAEGGWAGRSQGGWPDGPRSGSPPLNEPLKGRRGRGCCWLWLKNTHTPGGETTDQLPEQADHAFPTPPSWLYMPCSGGGNSMGNWGFFFPSFLQITCAPIPGFTVFCPSPGAQGYLLLPEAGQGQAHPPNLGIPVTPGTDTHTHTIHSNVSLLKWSQKEKSSLPPTYIITKRHVGT